MGTYAHGPDLHLLLDRVRALSTLPDAPIEVVSAFVHWVHVSDRYGYQSSFQLRTASGSLRSGSWESPIISAWAAAYEYPRADKGEWCSDGTFERDPSRFREIAEQIAAMWADVPEPIAHRAYELLGGWS